MASQTPINLLRGWPNRALLPVELVRDAAREALSDPGVAFAALEYGPDPGYAPCREAIADWLTAFHRSPKDPVSPDRLCVTGGASQNLGCLLEVYSDPEYTRNIWLVCPAYFLAFRIFDDAGFGAKMRAVPEDEQGIDLDYLRREMQKSEDEAIRRGNTEPRYKRNRQQRAKAYRHIIYCVPTASNPSSRTMSLARRRDLIRLAREFDALVTPDDVYDFLQWPADTSSEAAMRNLNHAEFPRLVDVDRDLEGGTGRAGADGFGNACSNGTFSKILGPGMRTGWVEGSEKFAFGVSQNGTTRSGGAPSQLTSTYVTKLLTSGQMQSHIQKVLCPAYASRYATLMTAIKTHLLPLGVTMPQPDRAVVGGYFVWLTLPEPLRANELAERCQKEENLIVAPGRLFAVPGDESISFERSIRLCFSYEDEAKLGDGIIRIAAVLKRLLDSLHTATGEYVVVEKGTADGDGASFNQFA